MHIYKRIHNVSFPLKIVTLVRLPFTNLCNLCNTDYTKGKKKFYVPILFKSSTDAKNLIISPDLSKVNVTPTILTNSMPIPLITIGLYRIWQEHLCLTNIRTHGKKTCILSGKTGSSPAELNWIHAIIFFRWGLPFITFSRLKGLGNTWF